DLHPCPQPWAVGRDEPSRPCSGLVTTLAVLGASVDIPVCISRYAGGAEWTMFASGWSDSSLPRRASAAICCEICCDGGATQVCGISPDRPGVRASRSE